MSSEAGDEVKLGTRHGASSMIPTASMADIAFLLIVFFILTFNVEVDHTQPVLPESMIRSKIVKKSAYVSIDDQGKIRFSNGEEQSQPTSAEELASFALEVTSSHPNKSFVIKAGKDTPYKLIDEVIDRLKEGQAVNIFLLTNQETVGSAGGGA